MTRSSLIHDRVRLCSIVLAFLMLGWIPVDLYILGQRGITLLTALRVGVAVIMLITAFMRPNTRSLIIGQLSLFFLVAVMMAFFSVANVELQAINWDHTNIFVKSSYAHLPVLILMLLCLFPLTVIEFSAYFILIFAVTLGVAVNASAPAFMLVEVGTLWIVGSVGLLALMVSLSLLYYVLSLINITSRDDMTGCYRREHGEILLDTLFALSKRKKDPLSIVFVDLDHFKSVNDNFGHDFGDRVLIEAARSMGVVTRHEDSLIRWGGEEFLIVCPGLKLDDMHLIFDRLKEGGIGFRPDGVKQTASCGAAGLLEDNVEDLAALIALADKRMYKAKESGRNLVFLKNDESFRFVDI